MRECFAFILVVTFTTLAPAQGLRICVVDAESGKPVTGAKVKRWASQWQPRVLRPPGKFWFPEKEVATDADGRVTIDTVVGDDWYAVKAEGYEEGSVEKVRGKYQFTARPGGRPRQLTVESGVVTLPLKPNTPKPGGHKEK